jgi:hypothetical protein
MIAAPYVLTVSLTLIPSLFSLRLWVALAEFIFLAGFGVWVANKINRGVVTLSETEVRVGVWSPQSIPRREVIQVDLVRDHWILSRHKVPLLKTRNGDAIRLDMFAFIGKRSIGARLYAEILDGVRRSAEPPY